MDKHYFLYIKLPSVCVRNANSIAKIHKDLVSADVLNRRTSIIAACNGDDKVSKDSMVVW